jgi:uncharacterized membrane protein
MMSNVMKAPTARLLRTFLTGLIAALPLAATVAIFWWAVSFLIKWLGPNSAVGGVLVAIGLGVTGSEIVGYLIGMGAVLVAIFFLGVAVQTGLQRGAAVLFEGLLKRIPLVGKVYELAQKLVGLFAQRDEEGLKQMSAVWCHFGGADGSGQRAAVLGLLSTPQPVLIDGKPFVGVIIPTAPVPVGGALLYLPQHWVRPAEVGIEALTSLYVSMGITSNQHLPVAAAAPAASASTSSSGNK